MSLHCPSEEHQHRWQNPVRDCLSEFSLDLSADLHPLQDRENQEPKLSTLAPLDLCKSITMLSWPVTITIRV